MLTALLFALATDAAPLPLAERLRQEALAAAERQVQNEGGGYQFRVVNLSPLPTNASDEAKVEFSHLSRKELGGRFFAAFRVLQSGRLVCTARVDLEGTWNGPLLTAKTSLPRKGIPDASAVESTPFEGTPPPGALTSWPEGYRLRQPVAAGKVITHADIEPIPLVSQGDRVRLIVNWGGLTIAADGTARSQGAKGERVRVELPSRKVMQALVTGEGEVQVNWQGAR